MTLQSIEQCKNAKIVSSLFLGLFIEKVKKCTWDKDSYINLFKLGEFEETSILRIHIVEPASKAKTRFNNTDFFSKYEQTWIIIKKIQFPANLVTPTGENP